MNQIKKTIIELIQPFTDKTLSEWCLLEVYSDEWVVIDTVIKDDYGRDEDDFYCPVYLWYVTEGKHKQKGHKQDIGVIKTILWHYDITAVLKYIEATIWEDNIVYQLSIKKWLITINSNLNSSNDFIWEIPNKPLHLYTEKEEKELLNLLLKEIN